jgi:hypothetical protein
MTITISNTANTNTFDYWRNRTNELAHSMSNFVMTTDSNHNWVVKKDLVRRNFSLEEKNKVGLPPLFRTAKLSYLF